MLLVRNETSPMPGRFGTSAPLPKVLRELAEPVERALSQVRAVVEHPFHIVKNRFRHKKLRYRGLKKNTAQLHTLFALANLVIVKQALLAVYPHANEIDEDDDVEVLQREVNPILFFHELETLQKLGAHPVVYAHPNCLITTFADMMINQQLENDRADKRHGSCGIGFNETIMRSDIPELKITISDLWNNAPLEDKISQICRQYSEVSSSRVVMTPHFVYRSKNRTSVTSGC